MKQLCLLFTFFLFAFTLSAQDFTKFNDIEIKTAEECRSYDSSALQAANYVLNTPNADNLNRLSALSLLIKWMTATPDYSFTLEGKIADLGSKKDKLLGVYMACMVKYCMENKDKASDKDEVSFNAYHMLATYCSNEANGIKQDKDVKKLIEADKNGALKDYLDAK